MRMIGVSLLLAGFLWLLVIQGVVLVRGGTRPIIGTAIAELKSKPGKVYSAEEVLAFVGRAANSAFEAQPIFVMPGTLMLVGGLLAARSGKRIAKNDA